ncbi:hypothetical protein [Roseobacter sp. AzwK-3b]|uniref:hypothetical protein n=1 Tax=Roseobacter sp. AzwK-3b TaxID=351016 RepID=UPI0012F491EE|nr:hypothetical protein [Roseobacter sp. AzwK-3b]
MDAPVEAGYAPDLIKDIDRYLEMRQWPDLLAPGRTLRPIAASSATTYRYMLLRFVSHVVGHGVAPQEITSMEALLQPAHVEGGLRQMLERNGGATCTSIGDTAGLLLTIAKHLGLPDETVRALTTYKERLAVHEPGGMTAKNRDRLRVLRNPDVLRRLLHLPEQIMARPLGQHRYKALRMREDAIAIGILLYCPLRVSNLSSLEIDRHLQRPGMRLSRKSRMPIISSSLSARMASAIRREASVQTSALRRSRSGQRVMVPKKP